MLRKILLLLLALCSIPLMALAASWSLNTWVKTTGGNIVVRGGAPQTSANGSVFKSYTTSKSFNVTVNANTGYSISNVTYNGVSQTLPIASPATYSVQGPTSQSVYASFAVRQLSVTASAGTGGTVTPTSIGSIFYGQKPFSPIRFTFTPNPGFNVINITGIPTGATVSSGLPAPVNTVVVVTFPTTFTFTANVALAGTFAGPPVANAGLPQTVIPNTLVTLDGSGSTGAISSYSWVQTSGPATVTLAPSGSNATFTPSVLGTYTFKLTVTGGSFATTTVIVTDSMITAAKNACVNCHIQNGVGGPVNGVNVVYTNWSSSVHKLNSVICANCHIGANTGGHPGSITSTTVNGTTFNFVAGGANFCITCHNPAIVTDFAASVHVAPAGTASCSFCHANVHNVNAACVNCHTPGNPYGLPWPPTGFSFHTAYTGTNLCVNCHNLHNPGVVTGGAAFPHFSTYSTAQFVTTNITCNNCHTSLVDNSFNIFPANLEWAKSGKANPRSPAYIGPGPYTEANLEASDYKLLGTPLPAKPASTTSQDCVRCHTTTGFINYVTPTNPADLSTAFSDIHAWGIPGDRTREMIACKACHNNTTGFDATFSRRSIGIETDPVFNSGVYNVAAFYGYSSAATNKIIRAKTYANPAGSGMFDSNICIACHSGKAAGDLIKYPGTCTSTPSIACRVGVTGTFWANVDFVDPHNMNSANLMFPDGVRSGYEYRAGTSVSPYHTNIGLESAQGPCVGCHMTSPNKHTFSALSSASNGVIVSITTNLCTTCHGSIASPMDAGTLQAKKDGYQAALTVIASQLAAKGIYYDAAVAPYYFTTADQALHTFSNRTVNWNYSATFQGANLMGAAFNLRLLQPGAGWVHNSLYSKRLLYDTIDYLDDGILNSNNSNNFVSTTIQNMAGIDQTTKTNAINYIVPRL
jgi:hypothetical protein